MINEDHPGWVRYASILTRDNYHCQWQAHLSDPTCGSPAGEVGFTPEGDMLVALCYIHSGWRP